jgi:hypothetical protein
MNVVNQVLVSCIQIEVSERRFLGSHLIGSARIRAKDFMPTSATARGTAADDAVASGGDDGDEHPAPEEGCMPSSLGSLPMTRDTRFLTVTLEKPASRRNPFSRGSMFLRLDFLPLTRRLNLARFFRTLPHRVRRWVIAVAPTDPAAAAAGKGLDRFHAFAAHALANSGPAGLGTKFQFGEGSADQLASVRRGTIVALGLLPASLRHCGQVIARYGSRQAAFSMEEAYEGRLAEWIRQCRPAGEAVPGRGPHGAAVWGPAVELMQQLNPLSVLELEGGPDGPDDDSGAGLQFESIAAAAQLLRDSAETLAGGRRAERAAALRRLAAAAPRVLCSAALHVPYEALVRELEGVVYERESGPGGGGIPPGYDDGSFGGGGRPIPRGAGGPGDDGADGFK